MSADAAPVPRPLLLSLRALGLPERSVTNAPTHDAQVANLAQLWSRTFDVTTRPTADDFEIWVEQACRLRAATELAAPQDLFITSDWITARNFASGEACSCDDLLPDRATWYGTLPVRFAAQGHTPVSERLADRYAHLDAFTRNAHRRVWLAGFSESDSSLIDALLTLARSGAPRGVVKVVSHSKYGMWFLDLHPAMTRADVLEELYNTVGGALMHLEDLRDAFLVQEHVTMEYEYRVFVVNHEPVTAAGCVEEHTPLDAKATRADGFALEQFSSALRRFRSVHGGPTPVVQEPAKAAELLMFATSVATEVQAERPELCDYVLDVAFTPAGDPLVVEFNPLRNSGLYASDPARVIAALRA